MLNQFDEDPSGAGWVQEGDQVPVGPHARLAVDELDPFGFEPNEFRREVVGTVGDVVECLSTTLEEATHGGIGSEWLEKFDGACEGGTDPIGFTGFGQGTVVAGQEFEETATLFD